MNNAFFLICFFTSTLYPLYRASEFEYEPIQLEFENASVRHATDAAIIIDLRSAKQQEREALFYALNKEKKLVQVTDCFSIVKKYLVSNRALWTYFIHKTGMTLDEQETIISAIKNKIITGKRSYEQLITEQPFCTLGKNPPQRSFEFQQRCNETLLLAELKEFCKSFSAHDHIHCKGIYQYWITDGIPRYLALPEAIPFARTNQFMHTPGCSPARIYTIAYFAPEFTTYFSQQLADINQQRDWIEKIKILSRAFRYLRTTLLNEEKKVLYKLAGSIGSIIVGGGIVGGILSTGMIDSASKIWLALMPLIPALTPALYFNARYYNAHETAVTVLELSSLESLCEHYAFLCPALDEPDAGSN